MLYEKIKDVDVGISIWKLKINCPKCGKEYLYSDVEAGMFMGSTRDSIRGWRFSKLPNNLSCENCGNIDPKTVACNYPIQALRNWSFKNVLKVLIPAIIVFVVFCIIFVHFL